MQYVTVVAVYWPTQSLELIIRVFLQGIHCNSDSGHKGAWGAAFDFEVDHLSTWYDLAPAYFSAVNSILTDEQWMGLHWQYTSLLLGIFLGLKPWNHTSKIAVPAGATDGRGHCP